MYTVIMTDLDRPNPEKGHYEEWCHWMVSDISVSNGRGVVDGGSSVLNPQPTSNGKTIIEYVPPHPAFSNPKKMHRYVFTVLRQTTGTINSDPILSSITTDLSDDSRAHFLPLRKFMKDFNMEWSGFGFITQTYSPTLTPSIFKSLGIHEPMYAKSTTNKQTILHRQKEKTKHFATIPTRRELELGSDRKVIEVPDRDNRVKINFLSEESGKKDRVNHYSYR